MLSAPVPAPALTPPPITLIRAARNPRDPDGVRWQSGFSYLPAVNSALGSFGTICHGGAPVDKSAIPDHAGTEQWFPVTAWTGFRCSAMGWQGIDWQAILRDAMKAALPKAVEHEFWTGAAAQEGGLPNLYLAHPRATVLDPESGTTPSIKRAFGALEQALADCGVGAQGVIHCRPEAIPGFTGVRQEGNLLLTPRDTIVVPGVGYPDVGPDGSPAAPGATWLYATGIPDVRVDPEVFFPADPANPSDFAKLLDRATNTITLIAEQTYSVSWDGLCHVAVQAMLAT